MTNTTNKKQSSSLYRPSGFLDILRLPMIGKLLHWQYGRLVFQLPLTFVAILLVIDGLMGPQVASRNLATVGAWVHYRGLVVLALLLVGNLFCMACPFTLPRTLAKGLSLRGRRYPRALRNKWLAISSLLFLFFFYEWLDLWASPALTAWLIITYFVAAFVLAFVPLGLGIWIAHYGFHFLIWGDKHCASFARVLWLLCQLGARKQSI